MVGGQLAGVADVWVCQGPEVEVGQGEAGGDVDLPEALLRPLHREAAGDGADRRLGGAVGGVVLHAHLVVVRADVDDHPAAGRQQVWVGRLAAGEGRSEEHTSELQSLMRNSYAVFCLKKKKELIYYNQFYDSRKYRYI